MAQQKTSTFSYLTTQLWGGNQVLVAVLGICSALGVTNRLICRYHNGLFRLLCHSIFFFFCLLIAQRLPLTVCG